MNSHGHRSFAVRLWRRRIWCVAVLFAAPLAISSPVFSGESDPREPSRIGDPGAPHTSVTRNGTLQTKDGLTLNVTTDLGSVKIVPLDPGEAPAVRYSVRIETDARSPLAERLLERYSVTAKATPAGVEINGSLPQQKGRESSNAQFWVQFEIAVPPAYNLEISTEVGDVDTRDVGGTVNLHTAGGNITVGRVGTTTGWRNVSSGRPTAKLETEGGYITVKDVAGDLTAITGGGHINAGNVGGNALLHTGGGHIRAGRIGGRADLETNGGNISVGEAANFVSVRTGGGQIDFGEVRGSVHAETGGGGIRVMYVSGPMEVESSGGSICLTRVAGSVRAATGGGTIRAWINPDARAVGEPILHLTGPTQLTSGNGDINIFLPRNLAVTIDALVESGGQQHFETDPSLKLAFDTPVNSAGPVRATASLNGGGPVLKLRTTVGKIHLQYIDSEIALHDSLIREERDRLQRVGVLPVAATTSATDVPENSQSEDKMDWFESMLGRLEVAITGGVHEDYDEFKKRLTYSPTPLYPDIARQWRVQGTVRLQVRVSKDGRVEVQKLLEGSPVLADAAIATVKRWRAKPMMLNGKQVDVISAVSFNFVFQK